MRRWLDLVIYTLSSPGRLGSPPRTRGSLRVGSGLRSRAWEVKEPCADVPLVLPGLLPVVAAAAAAAAATLAAATTAVTEAGDTAEAEVSSTRREPALAAAALLLHFCPPARPAPRAACHCSASGPPP